MPREGVITLEIPNPLSTEEGPVEATPPRESSPAPTAERVARDVVALAQAREAGAVESQEHGGDYESVEHLPRGRR